MNVCTEFHGPPPNTRRDTSLKTASARCQCWWSGDHEDTSSWMPIHLLDVEIIHRIRENSDLHLARE